MTKFNKYHRMFRAPDFGVSSLASSFTPPTQSDDDGLGNLDDGGNDQGADNQDPSGEGNPSSSSTGGAQTQPVINLDPAAFANAFKAAGLVPQGGGQTQQQPQLTREEALKRLDYWSPDENWFKDFGDLDKQPQAVKTMIEGVYKHAYKVAEAMIQSQMAPLQEQLGSFRSWQSERENEKLVSGFNTKYSQLAKPELAQLREMVTAHLAQQGRKFQTADEMYKAIADGMAGVIKQSVPDFVLDTTNSGGSTPSSKQNPNAIKSAPRGGGGGGGSNSNGGEGQTSGKSLAVSLLPPVRPR